jgi:predicted PurR-regulated permease PerM
MIGGARALVARFAAGEWPTPLPSEAVKDWPLVGERVYRLWDFSATNMKVALGEVAPTLKPVGERLLRIAQGGFLAMLELLVAIVVSGFLFTHGPQLVEALSAFFDRALEDHVQLAGATIRNAPA